MKHDLNRKLDHATMLREEKLEDKVHLAQHLAAKKGP
jgi:hypothetical protein